MKFSKKILLPAGVIVLSFLILILFHRIPLKNLWNGYHMLAVSKQTGEETVLAVLKKSGCEFAVSLSLQTNMFFSKYSPVQKPPEDSSINYEQKKLRLFFDKSGSYQLYYIPDKYSAAAEKAYKILLNDYHADAFMDSQSHFPWMTPLICILFAALLCFLSKNRIFFAAAALFLVVFTISQPFFADAGAVCMMLYGAFAFQNFYKRKNALHVMLKNSFAFIFFALPLLLIFASSISGALLCVITLCGCWASVTILHLYEMYREKKELFLCTLILPADFISVKTKKNYSSLLFCIVSIGCLLLFFTSSARFLPVSFSKDLLLPVPARYNKEDSIVSLTDYVRWSWYTSTYPYRSLHGKPLQITDIHEGDTVVIPRYEKTENGIKQTDEVVFRFDRAFTNSALSKIDTFSLSSLEKMMKKQKNLNAASYSLLGKNDSDYRSFLILILEFIIPFICFILWKMRINKK